MTITDSGLLFWATMYIHVSRCQEAANAPTLKQFRAASISCMQRH